MGDEAPTQQTEMATLLYNLRKEVSELVRADKNRNMSIVRQVADNPDSLTIGTPGNGQLKVYGTFAKPGEFRKRLNAAIAEHKHAKAEIAKNGG